jgi:hypothetical protein
MLTVRPTNEQEKVVLAYSVRVGLILALPAKDNDAIRVVVAGMLAECDSRALSTGFSFLFDAIISLFKSTV